MFRRFEKNAIGRNSKKKIVKAVFSTFLPEPEMKIKKKTFVDLSKFCIDA